MSRVLRTQKVEILHLEGEREDQKKVSPEVTLQCDQEGRWLWFPGVTLAIFCYAHLLHCIHSELPLIYLFFITRPQRTIPQNVEVPGLI